MNVRLPLSAQYAAVRDAVPARTGRTARCGRAGRSGRGGRGARTARTAPRRPGSRTDGCRSVATQPLALQCNRHRHRHRHSALSSLPLCYLSASSYLCMLILLSPASGIVKTIYTKLIYSVYTKLNSNRKFVLYRSKTIKKTNCISWGLRLA